MSEGILIPKTTIIQNDITYDTRRDRLQIALNRDPAHHDIVKVQGANIASINNGVGQDVSEVLLRIKHGLGYKPKCFVYFFYPVDGTYYMGQFFYAAGASSDQLQYVADTNEFRIEHHLTDPAGIGVTSSAAGFGLIRVKYSIFSNPVDQLTDPAKR